MQLSDKIKELIAEQGIDYKEKSRTILTTCPMCNRNDKFSILKANGSCICYRGSCEFGRRWFVDWLVLTANIRKSDARRLLHEVEKQMYQNEDGTINVVLQERLAHIDTLQPITFPLPDMIRITSEFAKEGQDYLAGRGISVDVAEYYGIRYWPSHRRVVFPVVMGGDTYGYQGRHIDKVVDGLKMRNNEGFRRENLVMFADQLQGKDHAIICEGPVDAIKFHQVGGAVCTMGKAVSDKQIEVITSYRPKKIYLALDADADREIRDLEFQFPGSEVFLLQVPESCQKRCQAAGKKADFGECTYDECKEAFMSPVKLDGTYLAIHLK